MAITNATSKTQALYRRGRRRIPGGTQLLSKRPEMFAPEQWPAYFSRAKGVEVWDLDGRRYIEMSLSGIGACVLGYGDPDVDAAVREAIDRGNMSTLNCPEEVELADLLCELHPWADMVRYGRCGGEAMAMAVRIARAHTRRDKVAFCGYHGWHDWYLAANLADGSRLDGHLLPGLDPAGVPRGLAGTALPFRYNQIADLEAIVTEHRDSLAAIVMEPVRNHEPAAGFLHHVREIATRFGAVLIFDEVSSGLRLTCGGAHMVYRVHPDIAVFAKAIGNGYPMAAVIGRGTVMQAAQATFISSTYWTDRIGPAAALATLRKYQRANVAVHLADIGSRVQEGWRSAASSAGLAVHVSGIPALSHLAFEHAAPQAVVTLFTQLMLDKGFLASKGFYASYAHQPEHVERYLAAVNEVFPDVARTIAAGQVEARLAGPVAHEGFRRLT
jgi:glutamate-1-semialdehyde 2,1-aminomutase